MTRTKYTPGPWEVSGAKHIWSPTAHTNVATVSEPRGENSDVGYHPLKRNSPDFEEACANAQLISAAPNLLDSLREILPLAEAYLKSAPGHPDNAKLEEARAAIVKAQGA